MKIFNLLIAGGSGFIGTNLLEKINSNNKFNTTCTYFRKNPQKKFKNVNYVFADLRNKEMCMNLLKNTDYVIMLAGNLSTSAILKDNPIGSVTDNTNINLNMLEASSQAGVKKYLWLSSTTGYPNKNKLLKEEDFFEGEPPAPFEAVGWMSRYIEKISRIYATKTHSPMSVITLRPSAVYGKYDDFNYDTCHALPAILRRVVEEKFPIEIWGSGNDKRDWLYVDDLVVACIKCLNKLQGYVCLNIGSSRTYNLKEVLEFIFKIQKINDNKIKHIKSDNRPLSRSFDCSKSHDYLGNYSKTDLSTGIKHTINWYKKSQL